MARLFLDDGVSNISAITGAISCGYEPSLQNVTFKLFNSSIFPMDKTDGIILHGSSQ